MEEVKKTPSETSDGGNDDNNKKKQEQPEQKQTMGGTPVEILQDVAGRLRSEDSQLRLNTARRLPVLLGAMTAAQTRTQQAQLAALFRAFAADDDDEVLQALAGALGDVACAWLRAGGDARSVLRALEALASCAEPSVRARAVAAFGAIAAAVAAQPAPTRDAADARAAQWDALGRTTAVLVRSDRWPARASGAGAVAALRGGAPAEAVPALRATLIALAADPVMWVRRAAVTAFARFIEAGASATASASAGGDKNSENNKERMEEHKRDRGSLLDAARAAVDDDQEGVRAQVPGVLAALGATAGDDAEGVREQEEAAAVLGRLAGDGRWRVRVAVAERLPAVRGAGVVRARVVPLVAALAGDSEPEVAAAAASRLAAVARALPQAAAAGALAPVLANLAGAANEAVRAAAGGAAGALAAALGRAGAAAVIERVVAPLLHDAAPAVALATLQGLPAAASTPAVAPAVAHALAAAGPALAQSAHWRVRAALVEHVPPLVVSLGNSGNGGNNGSARLCALCGAALADSVAAVRTAAVAALACVAGRLGHAWARTGAVPAVTALRTHGNYLCRITCADAAAALLRSLAEAGPGRSSGNNDDEKKKEAEAESCVREALFATVLALLDDGVANVRLAAARALQAMAPVLPAGAVGVRALPRLRALQKDRDADVRAFAASAINICSARASGGEREREREGREKGTEKRVSERACE